MISYERRKLNYVQKKSHVHQLQGF